MKEELKKISACLYGNVLAIGITEDITQILNENNMITECNILNGITTYKGLKQARREHQKNIKIKKIRKIFKRKRVDFIICDIKQIEKYLKTFVKNSIYINKNMIYMYTDDSSIEIDTITKKYQRYNSKVETKKIKNSTLIKINNENIETNIIKDIKFYIIDTIVSIVDIISDILAN